MSIALVRRIVGGLDLLAVVAIAVLVSLPVVPLMRPAAPPDVAAQPVAFSGLAPDECDNAEAISGYGPFAFNNTNADDDGEAACFTFGSDQIEHDVWYCWTAPCDRAVRFSTCGRTDVDTKIAVYDGCGCGDQLGALLACSDDACDSFQSEAIFVAEAGNQYLLRIGTFPGEPGGQGDILLDCFVPEGNDLCIDAIAVDVPSQTPGDLDGATPDFVPTCGEVEPGASRPGVWYSLIGTGNRITASLCGELDLFGDKGGGKEDFQLTLYCGPCDDLLCLTSNHDGAQKFCGSNPRVEWCSQEGVEYRLLVQAASVESGEFTLDVHDDGQHCIAGPGFNSCVPTGACCFLGPECADGLTAEQCFNSGGAYQGDGSACGGAFLGYADFQSCDDGFEDIAMTGLPGPTGDDNGIIVPIGFAFPFFGRFGQEIGISTNGYLSFGDDLTEWENEPIPSQNSPNALIAPYWQDYNPDDGGAIYYQTLDNPTRFIVQWDDIALFGTGGKLRATFQAVLFPDGCIRFYYEDLPDVDPPGGGGGAQAPKGQPARGAGHLGKVDGRAASKLLAARGAPATAAAGKGGKFFPTAGIENAQGTEGYSFHNGACAIICPILGKPVICAVECDKEPEFDPFAAMPQDNCADAEYVCTDIVYAGDNVGATNDATIFCGNTYGGFYDVWYRYRPAWSGTTSVRVCEGLPSAVSIHTGCPGTQSNMIACNFNQGCGALFNAIAGQEYLIRIAGFSNTQGEFELGIKGPDCLLNPDDINNNGVLDTCECIGDVNRDGVVNADDFNQVLLAFGSCNNSCSEDIDGSGVINFEDLVYVIEALGTKCPEKGAFVEPADGALPSQRLPVEYLPLILGDQL